MEFKRVHGHPNRLNVLRTSFEKVLKPLYGDQTTALEKIQHDRNRECRLAYVGGEPVGVLVWKTVLSQEHRDHGVCNSLEVKTLFLLEAEKNSGKGYASSMLDYILREAKVARAEQVHLTVNERVTTSLAFFRKKGFRQVATFPDRYKVGISEHLLALRLPTTPAHGVQASVLGPSIRKRARDEGTQNYYNNMPNTYKKQRTVSTAKHTVTLRKQYVHHIRSGAKTVEGRINSGMFTRMHVGNTVRFFYHQNPADDVVVQISHIVSYPSFRHMLAHEGTSACLPGITCANKGSEIYDSIPGYKEKASRFGVIAIRLQLV